MHSKQINSNQNKIYEEISDKFQLPQEKNEFSQPGQ